MPRKPKKHVVVSDMYSTIYSDVVMEDMKEFYPDASDASSSSLRQTCTSTIVDCL